jgi:hypothetical protein
MDATASERPPRPLQIIGPTGMERRLGDTKKDVSSHFAKSLAERGL